MISVDAIGVEFSGKTLFSNVSFVINENDKIALMGKNGAGKSTMMKIIAGEQKATRGNVRFPKSPLNINKWNETFKSCRIKLRWVPGNTKKKVWCFWK